MLHEEVNREEMQLGAKLANLTLAEIRKANFIYSLQHRKGRNANYSWTKRKTPQT